MRILNAREIFILAHKTKSEHSYNDCKVVAYPVVIEEMFYSPLRYLQKYRKRKEENDKDGMLW